MYKAEFTEHPVPAGAEWKVLGEPVCMYESSVHLQRYGIVDDAEDGKCHVIYDNEEESWVQLPREGFTVVRPFDGPLIEEAQRTNSDQREEGDEEELQKQPWHLGLRAVSVLATEVPRRIPAADRFWEIKTVPGLCDDYGSCWQKTVQ